MIMDTTVRPAASGVDLSGRSAIVTGGASGIGLALAQRLSAAGAKVPTVDLDGPAASRAAESIGGEAAQADLADVDRLQAFGLTADIIVNNAGSQLVAPVHEFPPDRFAAMLRLMIEAPFHLIRTSLPRM